MEEKRYVQRFETTGHCTGDETYEDVIESLFAFIERRAHLIGITGASHPDGVVYTDQIKAARYCLQHMGASTIKRID